jgi:hypothetical protein
MPATTGLHQPASRSLPHERIRGKREGICLPDAGPKGENARYKVQLSEGDRGGPEDRAEDTAAGSRQPGTGHLICNQTPAYIRGFGPLA